MGLAKWKNEKNSFSQQSAVKSKITGWDNADTHKKKINRSFSKRKFFLPILCFVIKHYSIK